MNKFKSYIYPAVAGRKNSFRLFGLSFNHHHHLLQQEFYHQQFYSKNLKNHQDEKNYLTNSVALSEEGNLKSAKLNRILKKVNFQEKSKELNEKRGEILPLLSSPLKTVETIERFMNNTSAGSFTYANDQTRVNVLRNKLLERKDELIVFEGTYHNMLELYNGLKKKISEHLNERMINSSIKTMKEKYLENHISKLEFTEIISRFGVLGRMENGSLKFNVKKLPKLDLLDRLGNFTIEQSRNLKYESSSEIFIPVHTLISSIKSMDQWEKKGIELSTRKDDSITIYPHFGVYMPTRKELFSSLVKQCVDECISKLILEKGKIEILDLGSGSGVFSIYVSKLLSERVSDVEIKFVDINSWALECSKFNFENIFQSDAEQNICGKYIHVDLTADNKELHPEMKSFFTNTNNSNSINLILCNPPWISIEKQDYEYIQSERMKFGSFKNTIDLSIFDTEYEFLDQFLNLLESSHTPSYGMLLVSNIGHLVGVENVSILQALEKKLIGKNIHIKQVFTLRREQDENQSLSVKNFLVNNPLSSKRRKSPHQDIIQNTKAKEEVYCIVIGNKTMVG